MCKTNDLSDKMVGTILMDAEYLLKTKTRIKQKDPKLMDAYNQLIREAELMLQEGPYSVTQKQKLPPSGDKHDYASYSRYWWPDPDQANGLPYIRKDGETNPESQNQQVSDRPRIGALGLHTETLGLAYYLTGQEKYALKAAELLRVWFLDEATRMNPNLNHGQCRPGHNLGTNSGILDGRLMVRALEGSLLIADSKALSDIEMNRIKNWANEYFKWLTTDEMALQEAASKNNHGSYYDAQALYFALYAENTSAAKDIAKKFTGKRINSQIEEDGSMPEEIARTRPLFYSIYNLHAMLIVAHLAEKVNIDIWSVEGTHSRLQLAINYVTPYTDQKEKWPYPTLGETDRMDLFPILQMAAHVYPDSNYSEILEKLPIDRRQIHRANLVFPLMR